MKSVIVGGGIGGLSLARGLALRGVKREVGSEERISDE
jgi:glycine/D-amino acid oxidase-like deaminating enzyme